MVMAHCIFEHFPMNLSLLICSSHLCYSSSPPDYFSLTCYQRMMVLECYLRELEYHLMEQKMVIWTFLLRKTMSLELNSQSWNSSDRLCHVCHF